MALSQEKLDELIDVLPQGMHCNNGRERLLCVAYILLRLTDAEHTLSNGDIRKILKAKFDKDYTENTIHDDIKTLAESDWLGIRVNTIKKQKGKKCAVSPGTWCERTDLTPTKVRLLLNAVQSSRSLTRDMSNELQGNLQELVSYQQEELSWEQPVYIAEQTKDRDHVLQAIDTIFRALHEHKKIQFQYTYTDFEGTPRVLTSDTDEEWRVETPIAIYYAGGNYSIETYTPNPWRYSTITRSRVDRMQNVSVVDEPEHTDAAVAKAREDARRRQEGQLQKTEGRTYRVFLRVKSRATNIFYDHFGFEHAGKFAEFEGPDDDENQTGLILVEIPKHFGQYSWLAGVAKDSDIVLVEPPMEVVLYEKQNPWARRLKGVRREELLQDYRDLMDGLVRYLNRISAPYDAYRNQA